MRIKTKILYDLLADESIQRMAILVFLHIVRRQDRMANAENIHYTEFMCELDCCKSSVYSSFDKLVEGGYILYSQDKQNGFYTFKVKGNEFTKKSNEQYLNLNDKEIWSDEVKNLTPSELKIYLYGKMNNYISEDKKNMYSAISVLRLSQLVKIKGIYRIKKLIENLISTTRIKINTENNSGKPNWASEVLYISFPKRENAFTFDDFAMYYQKVKSFCKRSHIDIGDDSESLTDTVNLINIYNKKVDPQMMLKSITNIIYKRRAVEPKYIHHMIKTEFAL